MSLTLIFYFTDVQLLEEGLVFIDNIQDTIFHMDPADETISAIPITGLRRPIAIDIDPEEGLMFWTDVSSKTIQRCTIYGTDNVLISNLAPGTTSDDLQIFYAAY